MGSGTLLEGDALHSSASDYVKKRISTAGGFLEGARGVFHKTGPAILGIDKSLTLLGLVVAALRVVLLAATALFPLLVRKVGSLAPAGTPGTSPGSPTQGLAAIGNAVASADRTDMLLGAIALAVVTLPKLLDKRAAMKTGPNPHTPYGDLAAAIEKMPPLGHLGNGHPSEGVDDSLRLCLSALRAELSELVGDENGKRLTDVTLLEFCDTSGLRMQVRSRTANEPTHRPCSSRSFMAYYVAMQGRWFAEHDFKNHANPFPKKRLTVIGNMPVDYRSVLYLPIASSERVSGDPMKSGQQGAPSPDVVDYCIGVICVHSAKPYRFWRWGDHKKAQGGLGDIAYQRSLPYISLITRLIERSAPKVRMEVS